MGGEVVHTLEVYSGPELLFICNYTITLVSFINASGKLSCMCASHDVFL
jgi:hypothetical protein